MSDTQLESNDGGRSPDNAESPHNSSRFDYFAESSANSRLDPNYRNVENNGNLENQDYEEPAGSKPNPKGFFAETKSEKACSV